MKKITVDAYCDGHLIHLRTKDGGFMTLVNVDSMHNTVGGFFSGLRKVSFLEANPQVHQAVLNSKARLVNFLRNEG